MYTRFPAYPSRITGSVPDPLHEGAETLTEGPEQGAHRVFRGRKTCFPRKFSAPQPGAPHNPDQVPDRGRASDSVGPGLETAHVLFRQLLVKDNVRNLQPPLGLQNPPDLPERLLFSQ